MVPAERSNASKHEVRHVRFFVTKNTFDPIPCNTIICCQSFLLLVNCHGKLVDQTSKKRYEKRFRLDRAVAKRAT